MRFLSIASLLVASTAVLAQSTTTTSAAAATSSCAAENIVLACLDSIQPQVDACGPNEWVCLCEQTNNLLTCYNNCPDDPDRFGVEQTKVSYCNAAAPLMSTSTSISATTTASTTSSSTGSSTETQTPTPTGDDSSTPTGGAGRVELGGALGAVGLMAALVGF